METEKAIPSLGNRILSKEDLEKLPDDVRSKYELFFSEYLEMKALYETQKTNLDGFRTDYEKKISELTEKYQDEFAKAQSAHTCIKELREQLDEARQEVSKLSDNLKRNEAELVEYRKDRHGVVDERDSLMKMVERRNFEVERLEDDIKSLKQQLQSAINNKCEALSKYDEIQHKESTIEFKEKRLEQERVLLQSQIDMLTADLNRNIQELQKCRKDSTSRSMTIETKLHEKTEELNIANSQIKHLSETNTSLNARIDELSQQLLAHSDEFAKMMEKYQKELQAKTRLADLYKEKSEEVLNEQRDITNVVSDLRTTLKEATDEYGNLETKYRQLEVQQQQEIEKKNEIIQNMEDELKNANELLKAAQQENIDIAVEKLCPAAATTSKLIKSGKSLTEIYSLYVNTTEELTRVKKEHEQMKLRFSEVLQEIQEKAPIIQRTQIDLEKATEANGELNNQLETLIRERVDTRQQIDESMLKVKSLESQTKELLRDRQDLSRQVCHLLQIIEQARGGQGPQHDESITSDMSGNEVITKRLVTFADIQELQQNNVQLLAIVRDLTAKVEEMDEIKNHMDQATYEAKIENYTRRLQEMQDNMELQTRMMEKCITQREHYKKLYNDINKKGPSKNTSINESFMDTNDDENTPSVSNTSLNSAGLNSSIVVEKEKRITDLEKKVKQSEGELKGLKEEYDRYRKEKHQNDEMLNKQFDGLRTELREISTLNCKLKAQVEHHDGQLKVQQKNVATYKKQIQALEDRNKNYESTIIKHETAMTYLRNEAMDCTTKLSRAEMMIEKMTQENRMLKDSETHLKAEREVLYRERQSHNLVLNNLEMIKTTMERSESEGKMRLESRLDELTRECSALRRRLQEEQDRFRELSSHLERSAQTAKERMEEEKLLASKFRDELTQAREEIERKSQKIDQLSKKLEASLTPSEHDNPVAQANKLRKEAEMKLNEVILEKEALDKELSFSKQHAKQYCDMAESYEKQLLELNQTYSEYKARVDVDLAETKKSEAQLKQKVNDLETEISLDINNRQLMAGDSNTQLHKAQVDLKEALLKISENNRELRELREKSLALSTSLDSAEQKYANEMILHSNDIKTMARMKEEMSSIRVQFDQLKVAREAAKDKLESGRRLWTEREENLTKEKAELEQRLEDLDKQNVALHDQIQALSTKLFLNVSQSMDDSAMHVDSADTSMNRSVVTDDEKSSEQLLQVIKYLRKEKDIAIAKFDILKSENARLKSELQMIQKKLDETQANYINRQDEPSAMNNERHQDLLRKVETLNAITDSNRILREERDALSIKFNALQERVTKVEDELVPLQEKNRELEAKNDTLGTENTSLKTEATRWRQRANALIERSNKNSPDDWKRLQTERENLAKMLQQEKDQHKKTSDEIVQVKQEKVRIENETSNLQKSLATNQNEVKRLTDELTQLRQTNAKMSQELLETRVRVDGKEDDMKKLNDEINNKETQLSALKEKEIQIRKIAKRYKDQYLELKNQVDSGTVPVIRDSEGGDTAMGEPSTSQQDQLIEDNKQLEAKLQLLQKEIDSIRNDNSQLQQVNTELRTAITKEESCKTLLLQAKNKIAQLNEKKEQLARELATKTTQHEQRNDEHEQVVRNLKAQYEARIQRFEKEISDATNEKNEMLQRLNQYRQIGPNQTSKPASSTMEKITTDASSRTANVKPMAGPSQQSATVQPWRGNNSGDTPLASIRPISVQNTRTAAVMPTTNTQGSSQSTTTSSSNAGTSSSVTALVPPQQVHTTGSQPGEAMSSSPTSSHTDYMPATSSATVVVATIPPMGSNAAESSSQSQEVDQNIAGESSIQIVTGGQQIQQAVALVSPRVENQQAQNSQNFDNQTPSTSGTTSSSTAPIIAISTHQQASSSNAVTTTQAGSHKRQRDEEGDSSTSIDENLNKPVPQKRTRVQEGTFQGVSESGLEVEYQVPTSSQRDQEDDPCIVLSSEEDDDDEVMPDEGNAEAFENDGIETGYNYEMEPQEMEEGPDIDDIQSSANNEVEVEDLSEVPSSAAPAQSSQPIESSASRQGENQQQIQSITSGTGNGNGNEAGPTTSTSGTSSSSLSPAAISQWRQSPNASTSRQQAQHLMLLGQSFQDDAGDDRIVPSTPTLYSRSRGDGFSEVVSSPHPAQVPHAAARFTFGESSSSSTTQSRPLGEGMDDTRIDLSEEHSQVAGRSVPNIPQQQQPSPGDNLINDSTSASTSSTSSSMSTVIQQDILEQPVPGSSNQEESQVPEISITTDEEYEGASTSEGQDEQEKADQQDEGDGVSSEGEKSSVTGNAEDETSEADVLEQPQNLRTTRSGLNRGANPSPPRGGRIGRGSPRGRAPITWNQDGTQMIPQQLGVSPNRTQSFPNPRGGGRARRGGRGRASSSSPYNNMRY
jgi:nucleoprotein TPR